MKRLFDTFNVNGNVHKIYAEVKDGEAVPDLTDIGYSDGYANGDNWVDGYWHCEKCHGTSPNGGKPGEIEHVFGCDVAARKMTVQ